MESRIFLSIAIFVAAVVYLALPFFKKRGEAEKVRVNTGPLKDLLARKEETMASLQELDLDFETKKVSANEYEGLRHELISEGAKILESIKGIKTEPLVVRPAVSAKQPALQTPIQPTPAQTIRFCPQCGAAVVHQSKFCSQCGSKF